MNFLITFITLSIINVVFSTIRSITTIKSGKIVASLISGGYFAFYNIMLIYTVADFSMVQKCIITFVCNVVGVWIVKAVEEKLRKGRLWKIEMTISPRYQEKMEFMLKELNIPYNYIDIEKYYVFNVYSSTQKQSEMVKAIANECKAKYFVSESKIL